MATVQETIDSLISYIDSAVAKHSVSNRHVATVLGFLNEGLKSLNSRYLSKTEPDTASGFITFIKGFLSYGDVEIKGLQTLHKGFETPDFNATDDHVNGAQLTRDGLFSVAGLITNSFTIKEFIYNVIRAQGGEYFFSPTVNIEKCSYVMKDGRTLTPQAYYGEFNAEDFEQIDYVELTLRDDECTHKGNPLEVGDILYGYVNKIGESGQYAVGGQCLMHVTHIDGLRVNTELYKKGDRGVAANIPPTDGMSVAQRGTEDANKTERMTSFYVSAESGSVVMLDNVNGPTLSVANYGATYGRLPSDLFGKVKEFFSYIKRTDPVVFARYGIFENLLQFDHLGQPILRENNRGEWNYYTANSTETTDGQEKNKNNEYKYRYRNTASYYDSVTHKGELWKCLVDYTTEEPGAGNGWLLLVASTPIYDFRLSSSSIYVNAEGVLSTDRLSFSVGENTASGYNILEKEEQLSQRNLKVQYSINGRIENEGGASLDNAGIALEDNSGFVLTEDGLKFMLDSISGRKNVKLSEDGFLELETGDGFISTEDGFKFVFEDGKGGIIPVDASCDMITLYLVDTKNNIDRVVQDIHVIREGKTGPQGPQGPEGKEGPIGQTGPMLIHDGNYDATKFYKLSLDENGKVIGKICVYLNAEKGDGTYLILQKSMDDRSFVMGEDGYVYPATSKGIRIDESNTEYWSKAPYTEQTFTRFLLANWAEFGSSEGAVFYGKHLFSQLGLGANGEIGSYYDYTSQMFDQNGDLTNEFVPNYFVDFKTGETKLGRLTESYLHLSANQAYHYKIDPSKAHNVAIHKVSGTNGSNSFSIPTIILPKENQVLDGVHCSIAHEFGFSSSWYEDSRNSTVFVCADEGIFSHDKSDVGYKSGWMVWKGYLVKFAFLAPGTVLNLRSVRNSAYGLLWNIENAEDFYAMKSDMLIVDEVSYDTGSTAGRGYIRLDKSIYEHQYSNPSVTRINNNNWWYKDVGREREDFLCIGSHVFSEYSEIKQWVTDVGNEFKKGEMRWVLLKDQQYGKYGHIRHLGTYDIPIPDFKQSDKTT